jgi:hypothetical protein
LLFRLIPFVQDTAVLFIVIRTRTASATQRALEVSLGVTRFRHREGLGDLHQYVVEQEDEPPIPIPKINGNGSGSTNGRTGPKVIKLDDESLPVYVAISTISYFLLGLTVSVCSQQILPRKPSTSLRKKEWAAPKGIAIYLSTIELPDLKPKIKDKPKIANGSSGSSIPASTIPLPNKSASGGEKMDVGPKSGSGGGSGSLGAGSIGKLFRHKS